MSTIFYSEQNLIVYFINEIIPIYILINTLFLFGNIQQLTFETHNTTLFSKQYCIYNEQIGVSIL